LDQIVGLYDVLLKLQPWPAVHHFGPRVAGGRRLAPVGWQAVFVEIAGIGICGLQENLLPYVQGRSVGLE
jgi:hypothetical protein